MPIPPPAPAERLATLLAWLSRAVTAMSGGDRLPYLLIAQIIDRLRFIKQRVARLAARIRDGRYAVRTVTAPCRRSAGPPRRPDPLPKKFGWLLKLVPDAVGYRSQLENLFADAEMAALLAAAPASLGRPLRSLCHMLGIRPPPILAPPPAVRPRIRPPKPERPPAEKRPKKPEKVRYVFGLRHPNPFSRLKLT